MVQLLKYSAAGALFFAAVNAAPAYEQAAPAPYEEQECSDEPEYATGAGNYPTMGYPTGGYPAVQTSATAPASAATDSYPAAAYPTGYPVAAGSSAPVTAAYPESTITSYSTAIYTISSCAPEVTNCPYGSVTSSLVPCTEEGQAQHPATSTAPVAPAYPTAPAQGNQYPAQPQPPVGGGNQYPTGPASPVYPTGPAAPPAAHPTGGYPQGQGHASPSGSGNPPAPYPTVPHAGVASVRVGTAGAVIAAAAFVFALF